MSDGAGLPRCPTHGVELEEDEDALELYCPEPACPYSEDLLDLVGDDERDVGPDERP